MKTVTLIILAISLASCAALRTNTQSYKTQVEVTEYADGLEIKPSGDEAWADSAIGFGIKLVLKGAQKLIEAEADKYEASWTSEREVWMEGVEFNEDVLTSRIDSGGMFVTLRAVDPGKDGAGDRAVRALPRLDEEGKAKLEAAIVKTVADSPLKVADKFARNLAKEAVKRLCAKDGHQRLRLTFGMIGFVAKAPEPKAAGTPHARGPFTDASIKIMLAGYTYPALKAKQLSFPIPFTNWDDVKSMLSVRLRGPLGAVGHSSGMYDVEAAFPVVQDERRKHGVGTKIKDGEKPSCPGTWITWKTAAKPVTDKWLSDVLAVPSAKHLKLFVGVVESTDLKAKIKELAEKVGEYEVDLKKLGID